MVRNFSILITLLSVFQFTIHNYAIASEQSKCRFIALKSNKTNIRNGPGFQYKINWVYFVKLYPLQIVDRYENWIKVRDHKQILGWVNKNLVLKRKVALVIGNQLVPKPFVKSNESVLFKYPDPSSFPLARVEFGKVVSVKKCTQQWCLIVADKTKGWMSKLNLWGIDCGE